ncbi:phosphopantetheine-binding protein [Chromobacterium amazonense]|uniref:Phosphopantetheine-binding protein n=1 Tax=Chromobacterium amazonense TaxID=1382803 RepID=A0ABU8V339_9NEIS|nr:phosphopantetheine-binding protein [Chromobacterium amazonense]MDQ4540673.1 phosphopantetheine-binding protein [Chromobacterium amazonense]
MTSIDFTSMCFGMIVYQLFSDKEGSVIAGRPDLADFLRRGDFSSVTMPDVGVNSLAWMELLTKLESKLKIDIDNDSLVNSHASLQVIANVVANAFIKSLQEIE